MIAMAGSGAEVTPLDRRGEIKRSTAADFPL